MKSLVLTALLVALPVPTVQMDDYIYHEDPCVEALRGAMEQMEDAVLPTHFTHREGGLWEVYQQFTDAQMAAVLEAQETWKSAKLQCWRH